MTPEPPAPAPTQKQKCPDHPEWNVSGACSRCGRFTCAVCFELAPNWAKYECQNCLERRGTLLAGTSPTEQLVFHFVLIVAAAAASGEAQLQRAENGDLDWALVGAAGLIAVCAVTAFVLLFLRRRLAVQLGLATFVLSAVSGLFDGDWSVFDTIRAVVAVALIAIFGTSSRLREWNAR